MLTVQRLALVLAFLSTVSIFGCSDSTVITQVVLNVDTDIRFPATIDEIRATIRNPAGETRVASAVLSQITPTPPRSIAITHGGDRLDGYEVDLDGLSRGIVVVSRRVVFDMSAGEIREINVALEQVCVAVPCAGATTCVSGVCDSSNVSTQPLGSSSGSASDAGAVMSDAGI